MDFGSDMRCDVSQIVAPGQTVAEVRPAPPVCDHWQVLPASPAFRLTLLLLVCCGTMLACGASPQHLLSPQTIAKQVGMHYGDPQAVIVRALSDQTEGDGAPMYLMTVAGQLRKDGLQAHTVTFSALATRLYVWDIRAFDRAGQQVWREPEWGACHGSCKTEVPTEPPSPTTAT
jgi:hypothetical protein